MNNMSFIKVYVSSYGLISSDLAKFPMLWMIYDGQISLAWQSLSVEMPVRTRSESMLPCLANKISVWMLSPTKIVFFSSML